MAITTSMTSTSAHRLIRRGATKNPIIDLSIVAAVFLAVIVAFLGLLRPIRLLLFQARLRKAINNGWVTLVFQDPPSTLTATIAQTNITGAMDANNRTTARRAQNLRKIDSAIRDPAMFHGCDADFTKTTDKQKLDINMAVSHSYTNLSGSTD